MADMAVLGGCSNKNFLRRPTMVDGSFLGNTDKNNYSGQNILIPNTGHISECVLYNLSRESEHLQNLQPW